jgi:hypothetical protein
VKVSAKDASVRRWLTAAVLLTIAVLAGCARSGGNASGSASGLSGVKISPVASPSASALSVGTVGTVTGVARMDGGPMMPDGKMADDGNPGSGITLTATQNGRPLASMVTGSDGRYRFTLAPGSYVVTGCADATIVVVAGQVDHQDIGCPIP